MEAIGVEPGAVRAGDAPIEIGDTGDHRGPSLGRRVLVRAIVAARVKAQRAVSVQSRNTAIAQIRFHESPRDRLRHGEQPPRGFRRSRLRRLYIARDNDAAGDGAAIALTERAQSAGIEAITWSPRRGDFNEDLRGFGLDALQAALRVELIPQDVPRFLLMATAETG